LNLKIRFFFNFNIAILFNYLVVFWISLHFSKASFIELFIYIIINRFFYRYLTFLHYILILFKFDLLFLIDTLYFRWRFFIKSRCIFIRYHQVIFSIISYDLSFKCWIHLLLILALSLKPYNLTLFKIAVFIQFFQYLYYFQNLHFPSFLLFFRFLFFYYNFIVSIKLVVPILK
jgi:hypothetical protein